MTSQPRLMRERAPFHREKDSRAHSTPHGLASRLLAACIWLASGKADPRVYA
jgi:hypothetical protein